MIFRRALSQPQYSDASEASITHALQVLASDAPTASYGVDGHWAGFGLGVAAERGWAVEIRSGVFEITDAGRAVLRKRVWAAPQSLMPSMNGPNAANFSVKAG